MPDIRVVTSLPEIVEIVRRVIPTGAFVSLPEALSRIRKVHPRVRIDPDMLLHVLEVVPMFVLRTEETK